MAACMDARPRDRVPPPRPSAPYLPSHDTQTDFRTMQTNHDKAYKYIEKGLAADESENMEEAVRNYKSGLEHLERALAVDCEKLAESEEKKDSAKQMQQKMSKTKLQIEYRIQNIEVQRNVHSRHPSTPMELSHPPSYEQVMSESGSGSSLSDTAFMSLGDSVMSDDFDSSDVFEADATEIYSVPDGVQIFFITPEGYVSAPSYPSSLKMFKFTSEPTLPTVQERPPAFLQVGSWVYPLHPGASPALRATNGAYIFPDATERPGSAVGLMLPDTMSSDDKETFESILSAMTMMQQQQVTVEERQEPTAPPRERVVTPPPSEREPEEDKSTSARISKGIAIASSWISWGIEKGAEKAGEYIKVGSDKIKEKLKQERPKEIDPRVQQGVHYVRRGTHVAVKVSSYVIKKLGEATMAVGREVAPVIRQQGEKLLPDSVKSKSSDGKSKVDGVIEVAGAGLKGFSTVYLTLEAAAKALGKNIANETVVLVDHKYGSHAGKLAENGLYAVGNTVLTVNNVDNLGIKAVAKRAAKDTGKALITDIDKTRNDKSKVNYNGNTVDVTYSKK